MLSFKRSFSWFIAARFQSSKNQNGFISFVSSSSTIGIGLGCFVLVLLLSVMNGFENELEQSLLSKIPHAELIDASAKGITVETEWYESTIQDPLIKDIFLLNKASGLLQKANQMKAVEVLGIDSEYLAKKLNIMNTDWILDSPSKSIVLGAGVLEKLSLEVGDNVQLLLPSLTQDLSFKAPKVINLNIVGQVDLSGELNDFVAFMPLQTLGEILNYDNAVSIVEFQLYDPFEGYQLIRDIGYDFPQQVYMSDWTRTHGHLYQDIQLVRVVVYIALALVICVACFNIVSSLVMLVKEKEKEIAILKTMGASQGTIKAIFVMQGLYNGIIGASVGTILGVLAALNITNLITWLETVFGVMLLEGGIYFVSFLPSKVMWIDVALTYFIALSLCVLATLYPANQAANVNPAQSLG